MVFGKEARKERKENVRNGRDDGSRAKKLLPLVDL